MRKHLGNGLAVLLGQIVAALGSLIGIRILTEFLPPAEYGHLTLGLTLALVVNQLLMGPLGAGVTRFYTVAIEKRQTADFLKIVLKILIITISVVLLFAFIAIVTLWALALNTWLIVVAIAAIFSIVSGVNSVINGLWLSNNQQIILSINQALEPWLRIMGGVLAIILINANGNIAYGGFIGGVTILLISQFYLLKQFGMWTRLSDRLSIQEGSNQVVDWQNKIFHYSYPYTIWGIFTTAHMASDRWLLQWYHGAEEVGYFAVLYQIGYMPMTLLTSMMSQILTPVLFKLAGDGSEQSRLSKVDLLTNRAVIVAILFMMLATLIGWVGSDWIFSILAAKEYQHLNHYLPFFIFAGGLFGAGQVAVLKFHSQNKTKKILKVKLISALLGIGMNIFLVPIYGLFGVVISLIIFATVYLFMLVIEGDFFNN
jgi:O-antigen/teichoic acid export membrane protein